MWIDESIHQQVGDGDNEDGRDNGITRGAILGRISWSGAQPIDDRDAERVERQHREDESVGEFLEGEEQHEDHAQDGDQRDGDVRGLVRGVHPRDVFEQHPVGRRRKENARAGVLIFNI